MPDLNPQPSKPGAIPSWKWLLMLLPSVVMHIALLVYRPLSYTDLAASQNIAVHQTWFAAIYVTAVFLCFGLGFQLEDWQRGKSASVVRALCFGFVILIINFLIGATGCNAAKFRLL